MSVPLKDQDNHKISGACGFTKEIEQAKSMRALAQFQEEEQARIAKLKNEESK